MLQMFNSNPSLFRGNLSLKDPISTDISTDAQHNINVIALKVLPCKRAVIGSMWGFQQVVMCTDDVVM